MLSLAGSSSILFRAPIGSSSKLWSKCYSSVPRCSALQPPDVAQLADTARITLSPKEVEDFAPKIRQVIDWNDQSHCLVGKFTSTAPVEAIPHHLVHTSMLNKHMDAKVLGKVATAISKFGQLQAVDLQSVEPSLRADTELTVNPREDIPEEFSNREAILAEIPSFTDPYIKVPKVLNKE